MSVKFFLYPAELPHWHGQCVAKTKVGHAIGINELVGRIAQSKTTLGRGDIRGVLETLCELIELEVTAGNSIQLGGICQVRAMVKGAFASIASGFEPTVNRVDVSITPGARLRHVVARKAVVEKIGRPAPLPDMAEYYDVATGTRNEQVSAGSIGQLSGASLSFDAADPEQGLFVVDDVTGAAVKVTTLQKATDKQMVFLAAPIAPAATSVCFLLRRRNKAEGPLVEARTCPLSVTA